VIFFFYFVKIAAVVMQEGISHIFLISEAVSFEKARIISNIPRKSSSFQQKMGKEKLTPHAKVCVCLIGYV
jgi:stalled ribosome rescue protein Dom34